MKLKNLLASILAVAMVLSTMCFTAFAADETATVAATLPSWDITASGTYSFTEAEYETVTLASGIDVVIELVDGTDTQVGNIFVPADSTLTIYGNTGILRAATPAVVNQNVSSAAIGGGPAYYGKKIDGGHIIINGGEIYAYSNRGAAIGGTADGDGTVTINGGNVTAISSYGAAIGGGQRGENSTVTINGGVVNAKSSYGAAIGGGQDANATVTITGGTVTARGGQGAAIGGGQNGDGTISISNATVEAAATVGAAIGGGAYGNAEVTITDSTVTAATFVEGSYASGNKRSAAIGGGKSAATAESTVTFSGTNNITVSSDKDGSLALGNPNADKTDAASVGVIVSDGKTTFNFDEAATAVVNAQGGAVETKNANDVVLNVLDQNGDVVATSTVNGTAVYDGEPDSAIVTGAIATGVVFDDAATENDSYIYFDLSNLSAKESIEIKLYSGDTLLSTTELNQAGKDKGYLALTSISAKVEITDDSSSWDTTWEIKPIDNVIPDNAKLFVDGVEISSTNTINMYNTDVPSLAREWGDIEGVVISPKGTLVSSRVNTTDSKGTYITTELANVYAYDSIVLKIYDSEGTLLATTTATDELMNTAYSELSAITKITRDSSSWSTTWEDEKLRADYIPAKIEIYVDGSKMNECAVEMMEAVSNAPIVWAEVNGVSATPAGAINVILEETDEKNVFNIKLQSADEYNIYEFVAAEFTFKNESTTVGGADMAYEILGYTENGVVKTVAEQAAKDEYENEQYIIRIPAGEEANRLSGHEFVIGQVKFIGQATTQFQGNIKFSVIGGEVDTTKEGTHLGKYYTVNDENAKLNLGADAAIDSTVSEIKRNVAVNVAFKHNIDTTDYWNGYQITATIKNNFGYEEEQAIKISAIDAGATTFENVPLGQITVTLKAPGFRTYTYKTVVEETADNGVLVLNFWNDIKRDTVLSPLAEIEAGVSSETNKNFVVGDIVMDMTVDVYDLAAVTSYYGTYGIDKAEAEKYIKYDLNRDGDIDIRDVQYVLHTMGN